ncbi:hypothetical protein [Streptacidiphilus melanogenes]|uniref:hypothetical protein n=1 Tax=Streptacidiphilus melanogenes TaxID=411235 RepID=UPI0005A81F0A|nr:hypothetical protein [Streptacidiphilus melanogenes]
MFSISRRSVLRLRAAATVLALGAGAGLVSAAPAVAKSDLDLHADRSSVTVGAAFTVTASGVSDDFGGDTMLVCVDERTGSQASWRTLRCTSGATLDLSERAARAGRVSFRAQLLAVTAPGRTCVDRTSAVVTVRVVR